MDSFYQALQLSFSVSAIGAVGLGTLIGLIFGAIPGLTFTVALALALPITFGMDAVAATGLLLGTYIGGMTGGSVSAILLGIPGTPSSAATVLDGYPLTRQGRASIALGTAVIVSTMGGLFSLVVMMVSVNIVSQIAIKFGPAEIFALVLFGMSTICGLSGKSMIKGLIAGALGLMVMTIGIDQIDGVNRMTFGSVNMLQGVNLLVAMIGLFAVPFIIDAFARYARGDKTLNLTGSLKAELPSFGILKANSWLIARCSAIGTAIGAIPGTGGAIAAFLAYDHARRFSGNPDRFGNGSIEGVIAPETANNAVTGGTLIPLLSLGIPGDPATAIVLAGLMVHGIIPGPAMFMNSAVEVYGIYIEVVLAYLFVLALQLLGIRLFVYVLRVPQHLLALVILVLCVVGSYSVRNSVFDIYTMAVIGVMAWGLIRLGIPITPVILGMVLGPTLENEFRTAMALSDGDWDIFYTSPVALAFFGFAALIVVLQSLSGIRLRRNAKLAEKSNA
ncbi:tripartite tricarboxylate transporter permease [Notoacmeibacter sp. MSK16QG-6]|uniref:tripartite tricarboxylate transporter permease n=1 Tax=Notoacmeibacter sp. MSK16QG-6 TaxID=2957982 RepID=UPI0020A0F8EA|nr:tripartite tricarboxylate transporter permease [Notoacmeibacter sp. MSK16QG-6]MCP1200451.1 tripartite tricarboxylate transporter permease [Notoacmeibacter sp. MSK16QG-6]